MHGHANATIDESGAGSIRYFIPPPPIDPHAGTVPTIAASTIAARILSLRNIDVIAVLLRFDRHAGKTWRPDRLFRARTAAKTLAVNRTRILDVGTTLAQYGLKGSKTCLSNRERSP